ncbi:hypothetical protein ACFFMN_21590 [Planobispora siamensis]|uniref:Uncharacterized protein n=1 Tax=Planobispora siamensis TaxID=936338 RepID=A0A8J3WLE1_9ACTN|nr:hypothetical protein [Planobispora siamensis]GIH93738.1 hypothetical protein Psi01_43680 [Planobispora siamensis]
MSIPFHSYAVKSADGSFSFTVLDVKCDVTPDLEATRDYADEDQDDADCQVAGGVEFTGQISLAGPPASGKWQVGWIQTIYPCRQAVTYRSPDGSRLGKMVSDVTQSMRDGDPAHSVPGGHCIWYDMTQSSEPIEPSSSPVDVGMDDQPNVPFHDVYNGKAVPWIKGWKAVAVEGTKSFCTWLVAEATDDHEIVYLYHVIWECDYTTSLKDGQLVSPSGGTRIVSHGPGIGSKTPDLSDDSIDEDSFPYEPDADLLSAKPA